MKLFGLIVGCFLLILAFGWVIQGNDFLIYKFFAPKQEQVRREVFENTKSYIEGMNQELYAMEIDYIKAKNDDQREALKSIILHRISGFDMNDIHPDLRQFVNNLKSESVK